MFIQEQLPDVSAGDVLETLENRHDRRILALAQGDPIDAQAIIHQTDIPKSTAYRRINQLQDRGLLRVVHGGIRDGHHIDWYQSTVEHASLTVEGGQVRTRWIIDPGALDDEDEEEGASAQTRRDITEVS